MTPARVKKLVRNTRHIRGWFSAEAAYLFALLDEIQRKQGIIGDIFEIGVHHGKSTIALGAMIDQSKESLIVCDIFGDQKLNVSASGRGDRMTFLKNFRSFFPESGFLKILQKPSSELTHDEVGTNCRLFHIDGGHSVEEALWDLELAASALAPEGLIILDDAFNPAWPSVTEAMFRFITKRPRRFTPLVIGFNKLVLVATSARSIYKQYLDVAEICWSYVPREPFSIKRLQLFGDDVYIFFIPSYKSATSIRSRLFNLYFRRPWVGNPFSG